MKKLIISGFIIVATIVLADIIVGKAGEYMVNNHKLSGDYKSVEHLLSDCNEDVLILGSSVALNGIVPKVISDSTGLTCFNGAANAQQMPFFETMVEAVLRHNSPKTIILGLRPDETATTGIGDRYNLLVPYYDTGIKILDKYLESSSKEEKYLLQSNLYRYNTIWWRILLYQFVTPNEQGENGFVAKGIPRYFPELKERTGDYVSTDERLRQFNHIVEMCAEKNVKLTIVFLPKFVRYTDDSRMQTVDEIIDICHKNGIKYYNDINNEEYLAAPELFYDDTHLNKTGAYKYTSYLVNKLKNDGIF